MVITRLKKRGLFSFLMLSGVALAVCEAEAKDTFLEEASLYQANGSNWNASFPQASSLNGRDDVSHPRSSSSSNTVTLQAPWIDLPALAGEVSNLISCEMGADTFLVASVKGAQQGQSGVWQYNFNDPSAGWVGFQNSSFETLQLLYGPSNQQLFALAKGTPGNDVYFYDYKTTPQNPTTLIKHQMPMDVAITSDNMILSPDENPHRLGDGNALKVGVKNTGGNVGVFSFPLPLHNNSFQPRYSQFWMINSQKNTISNNNITQLIECFNGRIVASTSSSECTGTAQAQLSVLGWEGTYPYYINCGALFMTCGLGFGEKTGEDILYAGVQKDNDPYANRLRVIKFSEQEGLVNVYTASTEKDGPTALCEGAEGKEGLFFRGIVAVSNKTMAVQLNDQAVYLYDAVPKDGFSACHRIRDSLTDPSIDTIGGPSLLFNALAQGNGLIGSPVLIAPSVYPEANYFNQISLYNFDDNPLPAADNFWVNIPFDEGGLLTATGATITNSESQFLVTSMYDRTPPEGGSYFAKLGLIAFAYNPQGMNLNKYVYQKPGSTPRTPPIVSSLSRFYQASKNLSQEEVTDYELSKALAKYKMLGDNPFPTSTSYLDVTLQIARGRPVIIGNGDNANYVITGYQPVNEEGILGNYYVVQEEDATGTCLQQNPIKCTKIYNYDSEFVTQRLSVMFTKPPYEEK